MCPPDYGRAALVYRLLKDYHDEVAPALRFLRVVAKRNEVHQYPPAVILDETPGVDTQRVRATGWFNHVFSLYSTGLITLDDFALVSTMRAAQLWVEFVLPLDTAIRIAAYGPDVEGYSNPVAEFWTDYAAGQLRIYGPTATTQ